jgi:hypothetical protein
MEDLARVFRKSFAQSSTSLELIANPSMTKVYLQGLAPIRNLASTLRYLMNNDAVFALYRLTRAERDLVDDMCTFGLDFFHHGLKSRASAPIEMSGINTWTGQLEDLEHDPHGTGDLHRYLRAFIRSWNPLLAPDGELEWRIVGDQAGLGMIGVLFSTRFRTAPRVDTWAAGKSDWNSVFAALSDLGNDAEMNQRVLIDGALRVVSDHYVLIVKRNMRRLWTASMARNDAEATQLKAMALEESRGAIK